MSAPSATTTTASSTSRNTRKGCGEENGATLEMLDGLVEDDAGAAQRADPRRRRQATAKRQRIEKPVAKKKQGENEDGDGAEEEQEDEEEEEIGHSLHLSGGGNGGDGGRKRQKRAKNVLNFISYVPPAPAPSRKKNLHTAPRLLAWLRENFEAVRGTSLAKDEVYGEYLTFCQADGKDPMLPSMFGKMVHRAFPGLKSSRTGAKGKAKHCYKGFRVRAPGGKPRMTVSSTVCDDEEEEEIVEEAECDDDEELSSTRSSSTTMPSSSSSSMRPTTIPSGSSSSSSPCSSPDRANRPALGRRQVSPGGGRLNSSSPSDGYFSSPASGAAHLGRIASSPSPLTGCAPSPPFAPYLIQHHQRVLGEPHSFLDMLQTPSVPADYPLQHQPPPHPQHSLHHHQLMRSHHVGPLQRPTHHQLQRQHSGQPPTQQYPPHLPASGMPLPHAYSPSFPYVPPHYISPPTPTGKSSPSPPSATAQQPPAPANCSSTQQPQQQTLSPAQQSQQQQEDQAGPASPIDCVPSPTSEFFFPPYISPLSVPLPFLPSFSFSLPPVTPPSSSSSGGAGRGSVKGTDHRDIDDLGRDGYHSYSDSSSTASSASSSPAHDASLCYEREHTAYAQPEDGGFRMLQQHYQQPLPQQQRHQLQQQQRHQQQGYPPDPPQEQPNNGHRN